MKCDDAGKKEEWNLHQQQTCFVVNKPISQGIHKIQKRTFIVKQIFVRDGALIPEFPYHLKYEGVAGFGIII